MFNLNIQHGLNIFCCTSVDKNPNFWKKHRINWDRDMKNVLTASYKPIQILNTN